MGDCIGGKVRADYNRVRNALFFQSLASLEDYVWDRPTPKSLCGVCPYVHVYITHELADKWVIAHNIQVGVVYLTYTTLCMCTM